VDADHLEYRMIPAWASYARVALGVACFVLVMAWSIWVIASGKPTNDPGLRFGLLLGLVPIAVVLSLLFAWWIVAVIRCPRIVSAKVVITPEELLLPLRGKHGRVPLGDIAGVGLGLHQKGRVARGGAWRFVVWRSDGSYEQVVGDQKKGEWESPERTRTGMCALGVYGFVLAHQGPEGQLAQRALQHHAHFSAYSGFTRVWDPATVQRTSRRGVIHRVHRVDSTGDYEPRVTAPKTSRATMETTLSGMPRATMNPAVSCPLRSPTVTSSATTRTGTRNPPKITPAVWFAVREKCTKMEIARAI
jgi:hypothetical protein